MGRPAIVVVTASALELARRLADTLNGDIVDARGRAGECLQDLFAQARPIVAVCAAGIVIRCLAPVVRDKMSEPPVIAVSEDGGSVVPLLGGHHGANALAIRIAGLTGGHAAVTTASDVQLGVALDEPPAGYRLANPQHMKAFAARVLARAAIEVDGEAGWLDALAARPGNGGQARARISVSEREIEGSETHLVYHRQSVVIGCGCARGAAAGELIASAGDALAKAGISARAVAAVASIDIKADEAAIHALADHSRCRGAVLHRR